jgi:hypothetical protein
MAFGRRLATCPTRLLGCDFRVARGVAVLRGFLWNQWLVGSAVHFREWSRISRGRMVVLAT